MLRAIDQASADAGLTQAQHEALRAIVRPGAVFSAGSYLFGGYCCPVACAFGTDALDTPLEEFALGFDTATRDLRMSGGDDPMLLEVR